MRLKRLLAASLCLAMLLTGYPIALAEETVFPAEDVTAAPTEEATAAPTEEATAAPTEEATAAPTEEATAAPTEEATTAPTEEATAAPTEEATAAPTEEATAAPTEEATVAPEETPRYLPSVIQPMSSSGVVSRTHRETPADNDGIVLFKAIRDITVLQLTCGDTMLTPGESTTWTVEATGGTGTLEYYFALYYQSFVAESVEDFRIVAGQGIRLTGDGGWMIEYSSSATYTYEPTALGRYVFFIGIRDENGDELTWQSEFYTTDTLTGTLSAKITEVADACRAACTTDYQKVKWMHDWLCDNVTYDPNPTSLYGSHYAESAMLGGVSVCQGYALAYRMLLEEVGVTCMYVTGEAEGGGHAWNMVKLDGKWYQVDVTWDDSMGANFYFLVPDSILARDHEWGTAEKYPACTDPQYFYYVTRGYTPFASDEELAAVLSAAAAEKMASVKICYIGTPAYTLSTGVDNWYAANRYTASLSGKSFVPGGTTIGTVNLTYETRASLTDAVISGLSSSYSYTGSPICPAITATLGGIDLVEDQDFTVEYGDNLASGQGSVTIRGIGAYKDTATANFTIDKISLADAVVEQITGLVYTGSALCPEPGVTQGGNPMVKDRDYTLSYEENTAAGSATVTVTGIGSCTGSTSASFSISPRPLTGSMFAIIANQDVTGSAIEPALSATYADAALVSGTDYTVRYEDNTAIGMAKAIASGTGNFSGEVTLYFHIVSVPVTDIELNRHTAALFCGDTLALSATVTPSNATNSGLVWASGAANVADVNAQGVVTAHSPGIAVITCTAEDGSRVFDACTVTVSFLSPTQITLPDENVTLGVGENWYLTYSLLPSGAAGQVTFRSGKTSVATVNTSGRVVAKATGTAVITATTGNDLTASVTVKVVRAPGSVSLSLPATTIGVGEIVPFTVTLPAGTGGSHDTVSSAPAILQVNPDGTVTGLAAGKATLTTTTYNGKKQSKTITVGDAPTTISFAQTEYLLGLGQTYELEPQSDGAWGCPVWSSSSSAVTVKNGMLTAAALGEAVVALEMGDANANVTARVVAAPETIVADDDKVSLGVGEILTVGYALTDGSAAAVTASSSSTRYAKVALTDGGVAIKGIYPGTVRVTIRTHNGKTDTISVTVMRAPTSVKVTLPRTVVGVGEEITPVLSFSRSTYSAYRLIESADPAIASITEDGKIRAEAVGQAAITATTFNDRKSKPATLTVLPAPDGITLNADALTLGVRQTYTLSSTLTEGSAGAYSYESDTPAVATVDADTGKITALAEGTARITVKTYNGKTDTVVVTVKPAPASITLSDESQTMGVKDTYTITYTLPEGTAAGIKVTSSYSKRATATVNPDDGTVTIQALALGTTYITVSTHTGVKETIKITVRNAPRSVKLALSRTTVGVGEEIGSRYTLPSYTAATATYTSLNPAVATVDDKGIVTAVAQGTVDIEITTHNGKTDEATLTVLPAPDGITLNADALTLGVRQTYTLSSTLTEGSAGAYSYESDTPAVATVDADTGKITAVAAGTASITVKTYNGRTDTVVVTVKPAPASITLSDESQTMGIKDTYTITYTLPEGTAAGIKATSSYSKRATATVNPDDGTVTIHALALGTTYITVSTHTGVKETIKITVRNAPRSVKLALSRTTVGVGEEIGSRYTLPSYTAATATYTSLNPAVATVDDKGIVTAVAQGTADIEIMTHNGKTDEATLTVLAAPDGITLNADALTLGVRQTYTLSSTLTEGSAGAYSYESDTPAVATVDADTGKITALAEGTARITVKTYNGRTDTVVVTVKPAPASITLSDESQTMGVKDTYTITYTLPEGTAAGIKATSSYSKRATATVNQDDGTVTIQALALGTTYITVSTHTGVKETIKITVRNAPRSVKLALSRTTVGVGEEIGSRYTLPSYTAATATYTSLNPAVATVDDKGIVTAVAQGTADIEITTHNGKTDEATLTVLPAPDGITLNADALTLGVRQTYTLSSTLTEGSAGAYSYESDTPAVATVDADTGKITAVAAGTASITVKTYNGRTDTVVVTVKPAPATLGLTDKSQTLGIGEEYTVPYVLSDGAAAGITVSSNYPKRATATVNPDDGTITIRGRALGTAYITVRTHNGLKTTFTATVKYAPTSIKVNVPGGTELGVGQTARIEYALSRGSVSALTYVSSNPLVATVDEDGVIEAVSIGEATITVSTYRDGVSASVNIEVLAAPVSIAIEQSSGLEMAVKETISLKASLPDGCAGTYTYKSDNTAVATVDSTGKVTAKTAGVTTVTVETYNGKTDTIKVTVYKPKDMSSLIALAKSKLGCKYVWANQGPYTFDCSGFTNYLYRTMFGVTLSRSAYGQGYQTKYPIITSLSNLKPGDILCFNTTEDDNDLSDHVALYIGGGEFIHASSSAGKVIISEFNNYYKRVFFRAFRPVR